MNTALQPDQTPPQAAGQGRASVSLARQLFLWLLVPQLVVWLAGGVASFRLASGYVDQAIDASLLQASKSLARQLKPIGNGLLIDFPKAAQDILEADPSDRWLYTVSSPPGQFILGNQNLPLPEGYPNLPLGEAHFFSGALSAGPLDAQGSRRLRIVALPLALGDAADPAEPPPVMLVQVARSSANREELAQRILVDMLLPMSGLVLLLTLLVWFGIRAGLSPLHRLRLQVEGRAPTDLAPLQLASAPRELWSLASAINTLLANANGVTYTPVGGYQYALGFGDSNNWFGTVRARLGFAVDRALIYGTGGFAFGGKTGGVSGTYNTIPLVISNNDDNSSGWALGGGVEYAFSNAWSVRLEYLHVDLGDNTRRLYTSNTTGIDITRDNKFDVVRAGPDGLLARDGRWQAADRAILATATRAPGWA